MIRAAAYCRVSTDHEDQQNSLKSQREFFSRYIAERKNWQLYEVYADEGITGTSTQKRVDFVRMIADAENKKFDVILTKEVSRFSRNILDTLLYTRKLREMGIFVIFLTDGINTSEPDSELRLSIMASIAQEESRKTSVRVKWGQTRRMEQGVVFGHSLLGYTVKNGNIKIEPDGAETVRMIFEKYVYEKKNASSIATELRMAGRKTYSGGEFRSSGQILKILRNEKYKGDLLQKKTCTPDYLTHRKKRNYGEEAFIEIQEHHEAIVSAELWETAQLEMKKRGRRGNPAASTNRYPLSGKIFCGECGAVFISRKKTRADGSSYLRWGCRNAAKHGRKNTETNSNQKGCDIGFLLRNDCAMELLGMIIRELRAEHNVSAEEICGGFGRTELARITEAAERAEKKLGRLVDAYISDNINREDMEAMRKIYKEEIRTAERKAAQYKESCDDKRMHQITEEILSGNSSSISFWQNLVRKITVYKGGRVEAELNGSDTVWIFSIGETKD